LAAALWRYLPLACLNVAMGSMCCSLFDDPDHVRLLLHHCVSDHKIGTKRVGRICHKVLAQRAAAACGSAAFDKDHLDPRYGGTSSGRGSPMDSAAPVSCGQLCHQIKHIVAQGRTQSAAKGSSSNTSGRAVPKHTRPSAKRLLLARPTVFRRFACCHIL